MGVSAGSGASTGGSDWVVSLSNHPGLGEIGRFDRLSDRRGQGSIRSDGRKSDVGRLSERMGLGIDKTRQIFP